MWGVIDIKVNKRCNYCSPIYLSEVTRKNMVGKSKKQSPERYAKKANYHPLSYKGIDIQKLLGSDQLVIQVPVGKYECTIAYVGVLKELETVIKSQAVPNVNLQTCIRVLQRSIDNKDIYVDCTCPDFIYRFSYYASKFGYKYGKQETRPPKITNPKDNKGSMCKHLLALLASKRWLVKVATQLNAIIRDNLELFKTKLGLEDDELFVNASGVHSRTTVNRLRQARGDYDKELGIWENEPNETEDDEEELEPGDAVVVDMSDDLDIDDSVEEEYLKGRIENGLIDS